MRISPQFTTFRCCGHPPPFSRHSDDGYTDMELLLNQDPHGEQCSDKDRQSRARCDLRSRFLELPAELRIAIYEYALFEPCKLGVGGCSDNAASSIPKVFGVGGDAAKSALQPPLTRVSRQIRLETLALFYRQNRIMLAIHYRKARSEVDRFIDMAFAAPAIRDNLWNVTIKHRFGMLDFRGTIDLDFQTFTILPELWYNSIPPLLAREVEKIMEAAKQQNAKFPDEFLIVETLRQLVDILGFSAS